MIDYMNRTRTGHIVTIEDPIEFLHRDKKSYVNQREVDVDTRSFSEALRGALRQDPDVILVGEMRDYETIETAITAAERGAYEYLPKPFDLNDLIRLTGRAIEDSRRQRAGPRPPPSELAGDSLPIVGRSPAMQEIYRVLARLMGTDLTVISYGYDLHRCLEAAARLEADEGIRAEVVDVRTLAPLDTDTILASVGRTSRALVVYEDNRTYGAGAEIVATIAERAMFDLDAPLVRIGGPDIPAMPYAAALEHFYMEPEPDHIYRAMRDLAAF